jgi:hypothetical protein
MDIGGADLENRSNMPGVKSAGLVTLLTLVVCLCSASAGAGSAETEQTLLRSTGQGVVVKLDALAAARTSLPRVPFVITPEPGPQFLFSDKPEYFLSGNGIALDEEVKPGTVRLYLYHVPEPRGGPKTISAIVQNLGNKPLSLRFLRRAFPAPSGDYPQVAKRALLAYFESQAEASPRTVPPGERVVLDPRLDLAIATKDQLVHGFYEFEIDQPARVAVFQRNPDQASVDIVEQLPKLRSSLEGKDNPSGAGRGLFLTSNLALTNAPGFVLDTTNGPMQLIIADGKRDAWVQGFDKIENKAARNVGNYGVLYRIRLTRASSEGRGLALLFCRLEANNQWCGRVAAAMRISGGVWPAGLVPIPSNQVSFGEPGEMVLLQKFPPVPAGQTETIELEYSPPGAACLPTPLLFVPYDSK